jgi:hypothetical protein
MILTPSVVTVVHSYHQLTARHQHPGRQLGGDKRLAPPVGQVHQVPAAAVVLVVVAAAVAAAVGELLLRVGVQHGVVTQVPGHPLQQVIGVPTQHPVRGVQEAAAGEQAAQLETPDGVVQIRKHKVGGTCDALFTPRGLYPDRSCL